jgi:hypothetical protein
MRIPWCYKLEPCLQEADIQELRKRFMDEGRFSQVLLDEGQVLDESRDTVSPVLMQVLQASARTSVPNAAKRRIWLMCAAETPVPVASSTIPPWVHTNVLDPHSSRPCCTCACHDAQLSIHGAKCVTVSCVHPNNHWIRQDFVVDESQHIAGLPPNMCSAGMYCNRDGHNNSTKWS